MVERFCEVVKSLYKRYHPDTCRQFPQRLLHRIIIYPVVAPVFTDLPLEILAEMRWVQHRVQYIYVFPHFFDDLPLTHERMPYGKTENTDADLHTVTEVLPHFLEERNDRFRAWARDTG